MWKLFNYLFGWDYIQWANSIDSGVARIHIDGAGRVWYWRYKTTKLIDVVKESEQVIWLTCSPEKYLQPKLELSREAVSG